MTNNHCDNYIVLMTQADSCLDEYNDLLDHAMNLKERTRIDDDEWYRLLGEASGLQMKYVELRDQAIMADRIFWSRYSAEIAQAHDRTEQQREETQIRNGG